MVTEPLPPDPGLVRALYAQELDAYLDGVAFRPGRGSRRRWSRRTEAAHPRTRPRCARSSRGERESRRRRRSDAGAGRGRGRGRRFPLPVPALRRGRRRRGHGSRRPADRPGVLGRRHLRSLLHSRRRRGLELRPRGGPEPANRRVAARGGRAVHAPLQRPADRVAGALRPGHRRVGPGLRRAAHPQRLRTRAEGRRRALRLPPGAGPGGRARRGRERRGSAHGGRHPPHPGGRDPAAAAGLRGRSVAPGRQLQCDEHDLAPFPARHRRPVGRRHLPGSLLLPPGRGLRLGLGQLLRQRHSLAAQADPRDPPDPAGEGGGDAGRDHVHQGVPLPASGHRDGRGPRHLGRRLRTGGRP